MEDENVQNQKKKASEIESEINQKLADAIRRGEIDPNDTNAIQKFLNEEYQKKMAEENKKHLDEEMENAQNLIESRLQSKLADLKDKEEIQNFVKEE